MTDKKNSEDRRPIPLRHTKVADRIASSLARRGVSPDTISYAGMFAALLAGAALAATSLAPGYATGLFLAAAVLIPLRGLCNMFDGMVAVEFGKGSATGALMNEVPDRISDIALMIGAGFAIGGHETLGYLTAITALFIAYVRVAGISMGTPAFFGGWMAKQPRMFSIAGVSAWLALAPLAWQPSIGEGYGLITVCQIVILVGSIQTIAVRLWQVKNALNNSLTAGEKNE